MDEDEIVVADVERLERRQHLAGGVRRGCPNVGREALALEDRDGLRSTANDGGRLQCATQLCASLRSIGHGKEPRETCPGRHGHDGTRPSGGVHGLADGFGAIGLHLAQGRHPYGLSAVPRYQRRQLALAPGFEQRHTRSVQGFGQPCLRRLLSPTEAARRNRIRSGDQGIVQLDAQKLPRAATP